MKKLAIGLFAAGFSTMLLFPTLQVRAQDWQDRDMANDAYAIHHKRHQIRHDYRELQNDLRRGDYGAAAHEQAEINHRSYDLQRRQQDLNNDWYSRNYNPYGYGRYGDDDD
jgi:hypothetical protein